MNKEYTVESLSIPDQAGWRIEANCADITFINYGIANLIINNVHVLRQGDWMAVSGNTGEVDKTKYVCFYEGAGIRNGVVDRRNYK